MQYPAGSPTCCGSPQHDMWGSYSQVSGVWNFALGVSRATSPCSGILWDHTSVSSAGRGEVAVGSEFIAESLRDPSEDNTSGWTLTGLHICSVL